MAHLVLLLLLFTVGRVHGASFYGDSFIQLATAEASTQTLLSLHFKTSSQQGLLFLAMGQRDFLLLELISGQLRVRLDLGSGESSLHSEKSLYLSDSSWHSIKMTHDHHNATMTVDQNSHTSVHLQGPDVELSVDTLFVGGARTLSHPYLQNIPGGFRGCLDEATFNKNYPLSDLRPYSEYKKIHEVYLGCSLQFSAGKEDPVGFFSVKSFLALPQWEVWQEGMIEWKLRPSARVRDGMVLYSSTVQGGFVAIELRESHLVATVGNGKGGKTELHSRTNLHSNVSWYPIELHLLPHSVHLKVGDELIKANLSLEPRTVQLKGPLFLGGLDERTRNEAKSSSVTSGHLGSFKGCLRDIKVNTQQTGLPNAVVSKDITVGCKEEQTLDMVLTTNPTHCPELDLTIMQDLNDNSGKKNTEFLSMKELEVEEGNTAPLEPQHIQVNHGLEKLGMHPSQIMFCIEEKPIHGHLQISPSPDVSGEMFAEGSDDKEWTFSMLDLWQKRVIYIHDGSEDQRDFFLFSIFSTNENAIPAFLMAHCLYRFDIKIKPVNDPPTLSLSEGNVFTLLEKSKRKLTTDMFSVSDPDSDPSDLMFGSLGDLVTEAGHFEHQDYPGRPINLFSLHDLEEGKVIFVHAGVRTTRIALRVSDGQDFSNTVVLRIVAVELEHTLVNNTGLEVDQGGSSVLTNAHLAVQINVVDQDVEIYFEVTQLPQYGEIQCLDLRGKWIPTSFFSQKLLEKEQIRYLSTFYGLQTQSNKTDRFECNVIVGSVTTEEVVFSIAVHWIKFKVTRSKMEMRGVQEAVITPKDLHAITTGVKISDSDLYFRLLTEPKKGQLFLKDEALKKGSTFSQNNVTDGHVKYELINRPRRDTKDLLSFQVFVTHATSTSYDFRIIIKSESIALNVVNKDLTVLEGGSKVISKDILFAHMASNQEVQYTITASPKHGHVRSINPLNSTSLEDVLTFTNQDIIEERLIYVHDDSETKQDSFGFQIAVQTALKPHGKRKDVQSTNGTLNIHIQLVNDQRPVRVVNKVFHVARDGQRLVTLNDLRYHDDDIDFEDDWLVYTRRGIPMGELVLANDTGHKLYEFTQRDLDQKKVLFIHRGVSFGRFVLFVTDGKHYVSTLLEVLAQDPYLQVENNTGIIVQQAGVATLTSSNLSVFSNLDIRDPREVRFEVFLPPKHGVLRFYDDSSDNLKEADASVFTLRDLAAGHVTYHHRGGRSPLDVFNVTARAWERNDEKDIGKKRRQVHLDVGVLVKIYSESYQRPPTVLTKQPVVVAEGQNVSINRDFLEVVHVDSLPSEIVFTVTRPPSLGFIQKLSAIKNHQNTKGEQHQLHQDHREPTTLFSQEDVNQGLLVYHQQIAGGPADSVVLQASNGLTQVGPIRLDIDIIPILLPLQVSDLTLDEGSSLTLTSGMIKIASHHFTGINFLYQIITLPRHGHFEHSQIPGMPITAFTRNELEQGYIAYIHDGSETLTDNFTIVANQTEMGKHSLPCTMHINVSPVNDEIPVVTINKGLKIWVDSVTEISVDDLSAEDLDTPSEGLEFIITPPSNGHLALRSAPSRHILNFTQHHIQTGQLVFVHSGALSGGFQFQVNDGVNFAPRQVFSTTAHSLVLILQRNQPMEVSPGSTTPFSELELQAVTQDINKMRTNHSVVYDVAAPPKFGRLVRRLPDGSTYNISTFTQSMVNAGIVLYDQNKEDLAGWTTTDSFAFTVSSPPAFLPPHSFVITISFLTKEHQDNLQYKTKLLNNAGAVVTEGGRVNIDRSKLDASNLLGKVPKPHRKDHHILYHVISMPRHGTLSIQGQNLTRDQPDFSQVTLNKLGMTYIHDDSETSSDSFTFQAWVAPLDFSSSLSALSSDSSPPRIGSASSSSRLSSVDAVSHERLKDRLMVTETFNITVMPVSDRSAVMNQNPRMKVVAGERVVVGPDCLQVEHHDTPPEELHYLVISKPRSGYLTLGERPEPVTSFTQYDVNHRRLHFIQQGEPSKGVFYFNVTDGHHRPLYKLLSLEVIKPSVSIVNNTGLSLVQGKTAVVLTTNQLAAQANGQNQANITYAVTSHPHHGRIAINDHEVTTFVHEDLQSGHVVYHMTDLSESKDSFRISVTASAPGVRYENVTSETVTVTVLPLIHLREPVRVPSGIAVKLGKAMIDASELARISRTDPIFEVLSPPKHGKLVKVTYDPNQASEVLKSFTFRDVVQGRVAIEETLSDNNGTKPAIPGGHTPATPLNDTIVFLLKAGNVQPAKAELHFTILPHHQMHHGHGGSNKGEAASPVHATTRFKTHNKTTARGGLAPRAPSLHDGTEEGVHPHIRLQKNHSRVHYKSKPHNRWGNHTHRTHGARLGGGGEEVGWGHDSGPHPRIPSAPKHDPTNHLDGGPVHVEVLPRPASNPLLIILPLLACLLLIVILIVLILVFRHRKEKQAQLRLIRELASAQATPEDGSYTGRPERSAAMPSVVVTPLVSASCPTSPMIPINPRRRRSLAPGMTFWGTIEDDSAETSIRGGFGRGGDHVPISSIQLVANAGIRVARGATAHAPTLKESQYWV